MTATATLPVTAPAPTIVVDSREKLPWAFPGLATVGGTLETADYSIVGMEHLVAVERKTLPDFLHCVGQDRCRFEKEMQRILEFPSRMVVLETSWAELSRGEWRSQIRPTQAAGSILGWQSRGIPFLLAENRERAAALSKRWLLIVHRRAWRESRALTENAEISR